MRPHRRAQSRREDRRRQRGRSPERTRSGRSLYRARNAPQQRCLDPNIGRSIVMTRLAYSLMLAAGVGLAGLGHTALADDTLLIGAAISKTGWDAPYDSAGHGRLDAGHRRDQRERRHRRQVPGRVSDQRQPLRQRPERHRHPGTGRRGRQPDDRHLRFEHGPCRCADHRRCPDSGDLDLLVVADTTAQRRRLHLRQCRHRQRPGRGAGRVRLRPGLSDGVSAALAGHRVQPDAALFRRRLQDARRQGRGRERQFARPAGLLTRSPRSRSSARSRT